LKKNKGVETMFRKKRVMVSCTSRVNYRVSYV